MSRGLEEGLPYDIPLHEMIQSLRQELAASLVAGRDAAVRFAVSEVELELCVALTREHGAQGGVKFWALSADAKMSRSATQTHVFRLKLKPLHVDGPLVVADEQPATPKAVR